ncbi:SDR family NAD(P)-dependent oxidoreductase [Kibdelosporangium aridum]|uniref:Short chain dehydrogenase n=1 Tax=Kibdelosporangium aridum TaxID=2030 RepID=A0A1Y5Y8R4_KIBAR|nr:SDR family NAD(P)-dependent oxidoreductase [Kibdelosporangium aridum]SMD26976.1 short chain dehydrogenase [Kibdelosporangium aridum]
MTWKPPPLAGRAYAVTGGNAGIGYFIAEQLAAAGADVVLMDRNAERVQVAADAIQSHTGKAVAATVEPSVTGTQSVFRALSIVHAFSARQPTLTGPEVEGLQSTVAVEPADAALLEPAFLLSACSIVWGDPRQVQFGTFTSTGRGRAGEALIGGTDASVPGLGVA